MNWTDPDRGREEEVDLSRQMNRGLARDTMIGDLERSRRPGVWSHRPRVLHLGFFFAAYVLGCAFAKVLGTVPGTNIAIWPPGGLFIATLILTSPYRWPWWMLAGGLAEMLAQFLWWHSPLPAGFLIYVGNALEAAAGAWLVNRTCRRPVRLETLQEVLAFVVLAAGIAPIISATIGSATLAWFDMTSQSFWRACFLWWIGDATGILIVAPLVLVVLQNWRRKADLSVARWIEVCALGLIFLGVGALSSSGHLPFAYIAMPPLLWAAVRFEVKGAAITLALLALITVVFALFGVSQFAGDPENQKQSQLMLQLFLAISAFAALIVATMSRQHQQALRSLRDRERELSQLVDMVPSHLWRLAPDGEPTFFSKRMVDFLGLDVAHTDKPGMSRLEAMIQAAVHPGDAAAFRGVLRRCLDAGESFAMRYRLRRADGVYRWMSSRAEPLRDRDGRVVQWYGLCHDIDDQVHAEEALRQSEHQLQQMIDTVPALIWCTTPEGIPCYLNKRATSITGVALKDLVAPDGSRSLTVIHPDDRGAVDRALARSFETGAPFVGRYRQRRRDGSHRWVESRAEPLRDDTGSIVQWYGVSVDIDDLLTAQEALRESERRYRHLFHYMPIGLAQVDASKLIPLFKELRARGVTELRTYIDEHPEFLSRAVEALEVEEANQHIIDMFGAKNAEEMRGPITRYWQPGLSTIRRSIEARYRGEEMFQEETRVTRLDGSVIDVLFTTARPGAISDKSLVGFIDITKRKDAEAALRVRERELSQLVDMVPNHVWRLTPDGEPTFYNKRLVDFLGFDVVNIAKPGMTRLASTIADCVHPDDAAGLGEALKRSFATGEPFSMKYRLRRADGVYRWLESRAEPLRDESGAIVQWFGANVDIDDQTRLYSALEEREARIRRLVDSDIIGIVIWDLDGRVIDANDAFLRMVQCDREDLRAGLRWFDMTPPEWQDVHARYEAEELKATGKMQAREKEFFRKDGSRVPVLIGAACFEGQSRQGVAYILDLSEQKRAEEALRQSERRLLQLVETVPALIFCAAPNGEPTYRSRQLREYLGFDVQEREGPEGSRLTGTLDSVIHPDELPAVKERYGHSLRTGDPYALKHRLRRFDGAYRWVETRAAPMRTAEGAIVQWNGICLDIEDQVRAQQELRLAQETLARASQAASLAELSASIAHEVNQPLAAVVANSHACQRWLTAEPPNIERAQKTVERIIRDANSAADVVGRIRALFTQSAETRSFMALGTVVAEARDLVAEEAARRRVRMDVDVESDLPVVASDRIQVQQVLINLIRNGMEAMESVTGDRLLRIHVRRMGDVVQTEIRDCGRGIAFPEKIFEPFFTTKENGMGMGLAICRSIVESHGGRLWTEKNDPHGATFIFTLPIDANTAS